MVAWRGPAVAALFAALTAALTYPLSLSPGTHALAIGADARLMMWTLGWNFHALREQPLALFDANIFHPHPNTLAYSEHLFGVMLLVAPWLAMSDNLLLAFNAAALLSCALAGIGAYVLARQLGISTGGAIVAGIIFAFAPPRFLRFAQLHLTSVHWMPFCLAFVHRYLDRGRVRHLLTAAAFFSLQALNSGHGALFLMIAIGGLLAWQALFGRPIPVRTAVRDALCAGVLLVLVNAPFVWPYFEVRREEGLRRTLRNVEAWAPNAASFMASPTWAHRAILDRLPWSPDVGRARAMLFPGYLTLVLAGAALWKRRAGRDDPALIAAPRGDSTAGWRHRVASRLDPYGGPWLVFYAALAVLTLWASLGPRFGLYRWLYYVPGFDFIRVPPRLTILTLLCLAVLAGAGLDRLSARLRPARRTPLIAAAAAILVVEFASVPLAVRAFDRSIPAADRWVAAQPRPFAVAEVPLPLRNSPRTSRLQGTYMLHSTAHWQPTVNGYSGFRPRRSRALHRVMARFPDEHSLEALASVGITYVIVHLDYYSPAERAAVEQRLEAWGSRLRLEFSGDGGRVYRLLDPAR